MSCKNCNSERVLSISGKCSDRYSHTFRDKEYDGYVPCDIGIGGSDYIEFDYCLNCGQIQDSFPVNDPEFNDDYEDDD